MTPRGNTRLKIWLVLVGVFVLGGVTGAALDSVYRLRARGGEHVYEGRRPRRDKEQRIFEEMKRDLGLTDEQAGQIRAILDETRSQYRAARAAAGERIRALLTPEQQQKFDAKKAEREARRGRDGDGGGR